MMLAMCATIIFIDDQGKEFRIKKPNSITIEKSWRMLTDTATIVLPKNVTDFDNNNVKEVFKIGTRVIISLGYNGIYNVEFEGYITKVSAEIPIVIDCQDEMWKLKQQPVNLSTRAIDLESLFKKLVPDYQFSGLDVLLPPQRHSKTTVAKVFEFLKQEYNLYTYFINGILHCDLKSNTNVTKELHLEKQVFQNKLIYASADEKKIKVNVVSILKNGDKKEVEVGDDDGETIQKTVYGITSDSELKKIANYEYNNRKTEGYEGSIETYGVPFLQHGDQLKFKSTAYPERDGLYFIETIKIKFNDSPEFHRDITLGDKA